MFVWITYDRKKLPISTIEDMHLANILCWIQKRNYSNDIIELFKAEAEKRKLTAMFLEGAPYPHKNVDGKWIQLDDNGKPIVVGR